MKRWLCLFAMLVGCTGPESGTMTPEKLPDRTTFPPVADLLVHRCGSLDCHGQVGRNLRLYGHEGLRLALDAQPNRTGTTTVEEYDEDYKSIIGLEPGLLGQAPDTLTIVRKARGTEGHKGGSLMSAGDREDVCLTSWLGGKTDSAACQDALKQAF